MTFLTNEAEYITLTKVVKEALWLKGITSELRLNVGVTEVFSGS